MKYFLLLLSFLLLCSCGAYDDDAADRRYFYYTLEGEWVREKSGLPEDTLNAKILIDYKYITITGKSPYFAYADVSLNTPLEGYDTVNENNDSLIFMLDWDGWKSFAYSIFITGSYNNRDTTLIFKATETYPQNERFKRPR
ncbi:MAG: hypothetical protein FWC15_04880 [Fibromonadales bacterium]|nr:hypothetical protein [Fibromonadales bacterium]